MRKKFTMLLAALCLCMGVTNAQVTKYYKLGERKAILAAGDKVMFYNTAFNGGEDRTGFLTDGGTGLSLKKDKPSTLGVQKESSNYIWTIEAAEDKSTYYKVQVKGANGYVGIRGVTNNSETRDLYFHRWTNASSSKKAGVKSENAEGSVIEDDAISADDNVWVVAEKAEEGGTTWNGNRNSFATWETGHPFAVYSVVEAETADLETALAAAKVSAVASLNDLAKVSIFSVDDAIAKVNAVTLSNDDLEAALNSIDAFVVEAMVSIDGKSVVFDNNGSGREGLSITANASKNKAYGTTSEGDETIWTIKTLADGSFKLYNFVTNKYLSTPGSNDNSANLVDEANAASYKFIVTDVNKAALVSGSQMLHQRNAWSPNYDLINWYDLNDGASLWTLTEKVIKVSREQYDLATAAKASLPYAIQQAYGLVTDASKYYSNYKSDAEGSYAALLDNVESSYFHSAYNSEPGDGSGVHYIQADLGEGNSIDEFYFYMKPRSGNGNNRPKNITVFGSNDNVTYTLIKDITTTLDGTMAPYMSEKLGTAGTNYRYIRLTVTSTNTSTVFFTLSELYFFSATADVTNLVNSYNAFATSSITSEAMASAAQALVNAETTLALANIKKEVAALLSANENNHAPTPALGQYPSGAYNALSAAYTATDATQESLEAAIAAFKKSLNAPVYFITSKHTGYAVGSAIYYDGAWKWKPANIYDRQMWMTIPGYTEENVPAVGAYDAEGTSYAICDYLTGTKMRGKDVQIVKVEGWGGAYNLQYNANASSTDAAQHAKDNGQLVNWKPGTKDDAQASVWGVEYIGNTYDLSKLTDGQLAAAAELKKEQSAKYCLFFAEVGTGLGQYQGDLDALQEALINGGKTVDLSLTELAKIPEDQIRQYTNMITTTNVTINQPVEGRYYRIKGANDQETLAGYYITGHTNSDDGRIALTADADASTIYYYKDGKLQAYNSGKYIGLNSDYYKFADDNHPASDITFAGSSYIAGAYTIKSADRYLRYKVFNNTVEIDRCENEGHANDSWYLEEYVPQTYKVEVSNVGYSTYFSEYKLAIPSTVTAYVVEGVENGVVKLEEVSGVLPANTGVILCGGGEHEFTFTADEAATIETNLLKGTATKTLIEAEANTKYYMLAYKNEKVGLYKALIEKDGEGNAVEEGGTHFYNNANKAYLPIIVEPTEEAPAMFSFGRGEGTTGIESVEAGEELVIYDLAGRRVQKMEKGIYIVNGRKVVVK